MRKENGESRIGQKEGNGSVHMGFALSDISPKAFTSEKCFIIKRGLIGRGCGMQEANSRLMQE